MTIVTAYTQPSNVLFRAGMVKLAELRSSVLPPEPSPASVEPSAEASGDGSERSAKKPAPSDNSVGWTNKTALDVAAISDTEREIVYGCGSCVFTVD